MTTHDTFTPDARALLREHFQGAADFDDHASRWDKLWKTKELIPWDRGQPSPALVDTLKDKQDLLESRKARNDGKRKKALVPGCGKGYDVLLLASHGYDAIGLDISESCIKECQKFAEAESPKYLDGIEDPGSYEFVLADFFKDDWLAKVGAEETRFDLIYDYTFFCALPPAQRPAWALRMSQLVSNDKSARFSPSARLVCLEFPTFKAPETAGPPFGLKSEVYVAHLRYPGEKLDYTSEGYPDASYSADEAGERSGSKNQLERMAHWQPERTHAVGKETDWISIWRHKPEV